MSEEYVEKKEVLKYALKWIGHKGGRRIYRGESNMKAEGKFPRE